MIFAHRCIKKPDFLKHETEVKVTADADTLWTSSSAPLKKGISTPFKTALILTLDFL